MISSAVVGVPKRCLMQIEKARQRKLGERPAPEVRVRLEEMSADVPAAWVDIMQRPCISRPLLDLPTTAFKSPFTATQRTYGSASLRPPGIESAGLAAFCTGGLWAVSLVCLVL